MWEHGLLLASHNQEMSENNLAGPIYFLLPGMDLEQNKKSYYTLLVTPLVNVLSKLSRKNWGYKIYIHWQTSAEYLTKWFIREWCASCMVFA